ncbi:MAG: hypothetical protein ACE5EQ_00260 [Phycisphaerae bacterium]
MLAQAAVSSQQWAETIRELLHYYLPPLESTPAVNVGGLVAIAAGLFLAFRGGVYERFIVCAFALVLGGWLGHRLSDFVSAPGPITIAITAVVLSIISYRTYRWWLAAGSVVVLFSLAILFQLGRSDLHKNLLSLVESNDSPANSRVTLPDNTREQLRNLHTNHWAEVEKIKQNVRSELAEFGLVGWIIPIAAAILGGLLAYWMLRTFAVVWLGFIGAVVAVLGGVTVLCANWHTVRDPIFAQLQVPAGIALGIWLIGLTLQAKEARFPKKSTKPATDDSSKS